MTDARPPSEVVYDPAFYAACSSKIVEVFSRLEHVVSIYGFGNVSAPGNSDLDFIFFVEDQAKNVGTRFDRAFAEHFSAEELWLVRQHDPMVLSWELAPDLKLIRPVTGLTRLHGPAVEFREAEGREHSIVKLAELLLTYYPYCLLTPPELVRWPLQIVNAYRFVLALAEDIGVEFEQEAVRHLMERNRELRRNCRNTPPEEVEHHFMRAYPFVVAHARHVEHELERLLFERFDAGAWADTTTRWYHGRIFSRKLAWNHHPVALRPLFAATGRLPDGLRRAAEDNMQRMGRYRECVVKSCNGMGLYTPWYFIPLKKRRYIQGAWRNLKWVCGNG